MTDICVITYNRLDYLKKCIFSILASTKMDYRLMVISDASTDGTNEWLLKMQKSQKIDHVIINETNLGSADSINKIIKNVTSEYFVLTCDDVYFHRGWDTKSLGVIEKYDDCGMVSYFDFRGTKINYSKVEEGVYKIKKTGLGSTFIKKEIFDLVGGFYLPEGVKMGFFASAFCDEAENLDIKRKKHYLLNPEYANLIEYTKLVNHAAHLEYNKMRRVEKNKFRKIK